MQRETAVVHLRRIQGIAQAVGLLASAFLLLVWPVGVTLQVERHPWPWWLFVSEWGASGIVVVCWLVYGAQWWRLRRLGRPR